MFPQNNGLDQMFLQFPSSCSSMPLPTPMERSSSTSRWKPHIEIAPNCPRCASTNTKFCYYNNYSLSQPRYFCKGCRRYWTKGGNLRNVPVGGGCRKSRRARTSSSSAGRNPQSERLYGANTESSGDDGDQTNGSSRDIDMAMVFAKFLNQDTSSGEEFEKDGNFNSGSFSLTPESVEIETEHGSVTEIPLNQKLYDSDAVVVGGGGHILGGEELSLSGIDELEGFLGEDNDGVVHDALFSDTTLSSSITWQTPMIETQSFELEYSMPFSDDCIDNHQMLPVSSASGTMNLISDSWATWNSFDLSTMEVFSSRP